jgi:hypothetical protein
VSGSLSPLNRALSRIPRRAEQRVTSQLRDTFVDSGIASVLDMVDHQVLYGRRGTGKTHAVAYLGTEARSCASGARARGCTLLATGRGV